jgi:putative acetyltransferase
MNPGIGAIRAFRHQGVDEHGLCAMNAPVTLRRFRPGEELALFAVFHSAIHRVARRDYSPEQIEAWAPATLDMTVWEQRIRGINPFVADIEGVPVGYADLQPNGYIDHFFVSGEHARRGIGGMLMAHLLAEARRLELDELTSDVSRTAQPFYERFRFSVVEQRRPELRGVVIPNALMRRSMLQAHSPCPPSKGVR